MGEAQTRLITELPKFKASKRSFLHFENKGFYYGFNAYELSFRPLLIPFVQDLVHSLMPAWLLVREMPPLPVIDPGG